MVKIVRIVLAFFAALLFSAPTINSNITGIIINEAEYIKTSFPNFINEFNSLGGNLSE